MFRQIQGPCLFFRPVIRARLPRLVSHIRSSDGRDLASDRISAQDPIDDGDSGIVDVAESTASITSSILKYRNIQGRTYHSEIGNAQYWYGPRIPVKRDLG